MLFAAQQCDQDLACMFQRMIEVHDLDSVAKAIQSHFGQGAGSINEEHNLMLHNSLQFSWGHILTYNN